MKRLLATIVFCSLWLSTAWAAPSVTVETLTYDFGTVFQGDKVHHVFRFHNNGDQILQVGNVRSSCGCTAAMLSSKRIAPGDFGELRVTFDSTDFKGAIHKTISIDSNDPKHEAVSFGLVGTVKAEILTEPDRIKWGRVKEGTELTTRVRLKNLGQKDIRLHAPTATNPELKAELSALDLPHGEEVELLVTATYPEGKKRLTGYIIIATDYQKLPQLRIPVSARLSKK
ncbi:Protein of unknown function [Malonomonas rubra DSM 5091]|uniref:DUF1573 domain-containing protein n=1 Tax=Malonomonas rubra DSM 5091 TaxID=1122189 RepID=A0A1M6LZQ2_MALRU|nr:DUF1573 domain-containing protein [Malonomonas rubra]SHJ76503.1 Protein of unknown function [Malonomonas rubra DSM 5091]